MKVLILVVVISVAAFATGQSGEPSPCEVVFQNGTVVTNECFTAGGLIVCEVVDMPPNEVIANMSLCQQKTCTDDSECSTIDPTSVCTSVYPRTGGDSLTAVLDACFPNWSPINGKRKRFAEYEDFQPTRCTVSDEAVVAMSACRVVYAGATTERPCENPWGGPPLDCSSEVACTVNIGGKEAALSFCEEPPFP